MNAFSPLELVLLSVGLVIPGNLLFWLPMLPGVPMVVVVEHLKVGPVTPYGWMPGPCIVIPRAHYHYEVLNHEYQHWLDVRRLSPFGASLRLAGEVLGGLARKKSVYEVYLENSFERRARDEMYKPRPIRYLELDVRRGSLRLRRVDGSERDLGVD